MEKLKALVAVAALTPWPLLAGPDNWWTYLAATAAILIALRLLAGPQWANIAGLNLPARDAVAVPMAFVLVAAGTVMLLPGVYAAAGLKADAPHLMQQFGLLFQALNEEILRALLIAFVLSYLRSPAFTSIGLAFVFAGAHFLLYRFSNPLHIALSLTAMTTLILAFTAMNNLYLAFRHIGFSWALHAGWNAVWLPAATYDALTRAPLAEPELFNRVLGSPIIAAIAGAIAAVSFLLPTRRFLTRAVRP